MTSGTIEQERGTYSGRYLRRHNGYWAGDFSAQATTTGPTRPRSNHTVVSV